MHVGDRVDSNRVFQHAIGEDKREPANNATADAQTGPNTREQRTDVREPNDQLHGPLHGGDEANAATGTLPRTDPPLCRIRRERPVRTRPFSRTLQSGSGVGEDGLGRNSRFVLVDSTFDLADPRCRDRIRILGLRFILKTAEEYRIQSGRPTSRCRTQRASAVHGSSGTACLEAEG